MELEGGCVENAATTGLGSIGEDSGRSAPLGPCDGGRQAWLFFGSAFMIEALLWGMFSKYSFIHFLLSILNTRHHIRVHPAKF
jgi:hypothetical protein